MLHTRAGVLAETFESRKMMSRMKLEMLPTTEWCRLSGRRGTCALLQTRRRARAAALLSRRRARVRCLVLAACVVGAAAAVQLWGSK